MDFGKDYAAMIHEQTKEARVLPLCMAWEFMPRPIQPALHYGSEGITKLARTNKWQLTTPLRQLLSQPDWAIVVTDNQEIIQYVNESFEQMTGYGQEVIGWKPKFLQGPETDILPRQRIRAALNQEQPIHEIMLNYHKDGTTYWCDLTILPVHNDRQQLINFIAFERESVA